MSRSAVPLRIVVVGGGFTGAALTIHLVRATTRPLDIAIVEPSAELGRGIAYGTTDPVHRINVPSARMSLFRDDPDHLTRWLFERGILPDPASTDSCGHHYVRRSAFGDYVGDMLGRTIAEAGPRVAFRHLRAKALSVAAGEAGWTVGLADGRKIDADCLMMCSGHSSPALPCPVSLEALGTSRFVRNPWTGNAFAPIGAEDAVLIVGTGLTMADAIASLEEAGHRGPVTAISRRSLLARPQGAFLDGIDLLAGAPAPTSALGLLRLLRRRIAELSTVTGWQPVVDALRYQLREIWRGLPAREQRRVVRRLLPFWEVHRFRMAPQPHDLLRRQMQAKRLRLEQAGIAGVEVESGRLVAELGRSGKKAERRAFDAIVLCTGPANALRTDPLVTAMLSSGVVRPDAVGLGVAVDERSRPLDRGGHPRDGLWVFGPLTRGSFGEMTGAPDIVRHIEVLVPDIVLSLETKGQLTHDAA